MSQRIHRLWPSAVALVALVLVYFGERVLSGFDTWRLVMAGSAAVLLLAAIGMRFKELSDAPEARKPVLKSLLGSLVLIAAGLILYALIPLMFDGESESQQRFRGVLWALFPVVTALGLGPMIAVELAVYPVAYIDRYELRRVYRAINRGLAVSLLLSAVFLANYVAKKNEVKVDFAAAGKVEPSTTTRRIFEELAQPVRVIAFFPEANEVADVVAAYFDKLGNLPNVELIKADQALEPKLASETSTNENGYVVVSQGKEHEKIRIGEKMQNARTALKNFDGNLAKAVAKVARQQAVAYFTVGHNERRFESTSEDPRPQIVNLKNILTANKYEVKRLGVAEGLATDVPRDAALVAIIGPEKPFLPEEIASLKRAIERGVRLLICLESEREGENLNELLAELGLKFEKTTLANEQAFVRLTQSEADRAFIYTNRFSSHDSVTTMTRFAARLATVFARSGYLEKLEPLPKGTRVDTVITSMDGTFADLDGDHALDKGTEKQAGFALGAAVTRTASAAETRAFVLADADVFTDKWLRLVEGNNYLFGDVVYWLRDIKDPVISTITEEDVRIVHKRDEDALWFYSTTIGVPLLVGLGGFFGARRRRRQ